MDLNLSGMFRDASVQNLGWLAEGLDETFEPQNNQGRMKSELQLQWGYGDIDPQYPTPPSAEESTMPNGQPVVRFARRLMLEGKMGPQVVRELRDKFPAASIKAAVPGLKKLAEQEGLLGCVLVDAQDFDSCKDAMKAASRSPFKRHLRYVTNCKCGRHVMPVEPSEHIVEAASSGNGIDDFIGSSIAPPAAMREVCKSTHKEVWAGEGELPEEFVDNTLIDLTTTEKLSEPQQEQVKAKRKKKGNREALALAFRLAAKNRNAKPDYSGDVDTSEHVVEQADMEVELPGPAAADIDVDPVNKALASMPVELDGVPEGSLDGVGELGQAENEIALAAEAEAPFEGVDLVNAALSQTVEPVKAAKAPEQLDVEMQSMPGELSVLGAAALEVEGLSSKAAIKLRPKVEAAEELDVAVHESLAGEIPIDDAFTAAGVEEVGADLGIEFEAAKEAGELDVSRGTTGVDVDVAARKASLEIDAAGFVPKEFEGGDVIELESKERVAELDVDANGSFDFDL